MANTRSAEKNVRKTKTRTARNQERKGTIRNSRKRIDAAIKSGDLKAAEKELGAFASAADKAAKTNTIHKNKASRLKSRMALKIKKAALAGTPA